MEHPADPMSLTCALTGDVRYDKHTHTHLRVKLTSLNKLSTVELLVGDAAAMGRKKS